MQLTGGLPTFTEVNALAGQLDAGVPRDQVVRVIVNSQEFRAAAVQGLYESIFGRAPDPTKLAEGLDALQQRKTLVQLQADWLIQLGQSNNLGILSFENILFQTALGRSPTSQEATGAVLGRTAPAPPAHYRAGDWKA